MKISTSHWSKLSNFDVDRFSAPSGQISEDLCVIEIDISMAETQVFLVDMASMTLFLENNYWAQEQVRLVEEALKTLDKLNIKPELLTRRTVLLGVWHFGHLLGDHVHNFIRHYRRESNGSLGYPIHISSDFSGLSQLSELLSLPRLRHDVISNTRAKRSTRIYRLLDCTCIYPAIDKSIPLSIANTHVRLSMVDDIRESGSNNVFLTSGRSSRIVNINQLTEHLSESSWIILNPLNTPAMTTLRMIKRARLLVCENGSILFNCFLARERSYFVLGSTRIKSVENNSYFGGIVYNRYHESVLQYILLPPLQISHHPFSDQISVPFVFFSTLGSL